MTERLIRSYPRLTAEDVERLMQFYQVDTMKTLIEAQAHHVERLQAKLSPLRDTQPGRVREG